MSEQPNNKRGNNVVLITLAAIAGVVSIVVGLLAMISGVYAMAEPMEQRIDFTERQLVELRKQILNERERDTGGLANQITELEQRNSKERERNLKILTDRIAELQKELRVLDERERDAVAQFAMILVTFTEIQTQFDALREREDARADDLENRLDRRRGRTNDEHRAMMREIALQLEGLRRRLAKLEGYWIIVPDKDQTGAWGRMFDQQQEGGNHGD